MKHLLVAAFAACCAVLSACSPAPETATLTFTAIPDQDVSRLQSRFAKVADYLSDRLDVAVRYVPVTSYAAAVTAFTNGEVQLAWFGGLSGVQAVSRVPGSRAIAQGEEDTHFVSYLIAHHSTGLEPLESLDDRLRDRTFTFGSKGSTSGRLMPQYFLEQAFGEKPQQIFSRVGFSGDHSATIALVQSGAYQLGVLNYKVWQQELAEGKIDTDKVSVIWQTPSYPDYHWVIRGDSETQFGEGFIERVQQAMLAIDDPAILAAFPRSRFIAAQNSDYQPILDTARAIGLMDPAH